MYVACLIAPIGSAKQSQTPRERPTDTDKKYKQSKNLGRQISDTSAIKTYRNKRRQRTMRVKLRQKCKHKRRQKRRQKLRLR